MEGKRVRYLADVNVLLAGLWSFFPEHRVALAWLTRNRWAYCSITEAGFIRISLQPAFQQHAAISAAALAEVFRKLVESCKAVKWNDLRPFHLSPLLQAETSASQVTDVYLCELVAQHKGKLATLDAQLQGMHPNHTFVIPKQ
jgi:predicted nucleic acid-binding protein